jgi:hypothetical protein
MRGRSPHTYTLHYPDILSCSMFCHDILSVCYISITKNMKRFIALCWSYRMYYFTSKMDKRIRRAMIMKDLLALNH